MSPKSSQIEGTCLRWKNFCVRAPGFDGVVDCSLVIGFVENVLGIEEERSHKIL
jgi:hypothetical protein